MSSSTVLGKLESTVLYHLWERIVNNNAPSLYSWQEETAFLHKIGLGMEEVIRYLFQEKPPLDQFEEWVISHDLGFTTATGLNAFLANVKLGEEVFTEDVLSPADLAFWEANGYIVLKAAVSKSQCKAAVEAIWDHLHASLEDASSWYKPHPDRWGIMLDFVHHPALRANRDSVRIEKAYRQLYGTNELVKVIDKVGYNPPNDDWHSFMGSPLHWDTSLVPPISNHLQGLLYLTDTGEKDGAFHCVPGFHLEIEKWLANLPSDVDPRQFAIANLRPIPIPGEAGDFVIWKAALPHCATPNKGKTPRMVQYLTYLPIEKEAEKGWL